MSISYEEARELLRYEPDTGKLYRKKTSGPGKAFTEAGSIGNDGYRRVGIKGKHRVFHRIAWLLYYGEFPKNEIDHIDGNRLNNRIENLRDVTSSTNSRNQKKPKNNTSGHIGVVWSKSTNKWQAQISVSGKMKHLGVYSDMSEAIQARKQGEKEIGFHKNHGRI